ncbi:MAG: substrate-binding domain-containing protein, partial [Gammaproteobacteria bacterium]
MQKTYYLLSLVVCFVSGLVNAQERLRLATTTSTDNSGLLAVLHPPFEKQYEIYVDVIAVGTGKALRLGENGDVDVVMVHA